MSDVINILPDAIANQIAAGEVVQRPASVVKELLENSIDAHSSLIRLLVFEGGKNGIQVIDDGIGMSPLDAHLCFERHATSKIRQASDLEMIMTMGFRGEALASIAAVSELTLITRRGEDEIGTKISISGSRVVDKAPVACPVGTNFSIRNLFFNVPARRRFLKSTSVEMRHVVNEFLRVALAHPDVGMMLYHQQSTIYKLVPTTLQQRIIDIFGKELTTALIPFEHVAETVELKGFLVDPLRIKKRFSEQYLFVNDRYMKSPYFNKAILSAYERLLPPEVLPSFFITFKIDPRRIDVNIHPTKTEVKFQDEQVIWEIIFSAVRKTLGRSTGLMEERKEITDVSKASVFGSSVKQKEFTVGIKPSPFSSTRVASSQVTPQVSIRPSEVERSPSSILSPGLASTALAAYNTLYIDNTYIVTTVENQLRIINQHRAHARVLYERFTHGDLPTSQNLLIPVKMELIPSQKVGIESFVEALGEVGVVVELDEARNLVLKSYFTTVPPVDPMRFLQTLYQEYMQKGEASLERVTDPSRRAMAFAMAYRYHEPLSVEQQRQLVHDLLECEEPMLDPKRRPTMKVLGLADIEHFLA